MTGASRPPLSQCPSQLRTHSHPLHTLLAISSSTLLLASTHKNLNTDQCPNHTHLTSHFYHLDIYYGGAGEDGAEARSFGCEVSGGRIGEGIKNEALHGAGRCRKMVSASGQESIGSSPLSTLKQFLPPKPKPKPKKLSPQPSSSSQPSKALHAHQATTL
jgi:hypothetical protein